MVKGVEDISTNLSVNIESPDPLRVTQNEKKIKTRRLHVQDPEKSQTQKYYYNWFCSVFNVVCMVNVCPVHAVDLN